MLSGFIREGVNLLLTLVKPNPKVEPPEAESPEEAFQRLYGQPTTEQQLKLKAAEKAMEAVDQELKARNLELPTEEETTKELRRRLGKEIYRLELDLQSRLKIAGKPCDCAGKKHNLGLEATAEELIGKEPHNTVYPEIIDWLRVNEAKMTLRASASGQYDNEYPAMAKAISRFRKRIEL